MTKIGTIYIDELTLGMERTLEKTITMREIEMFAELSTDHNPVHLDEEYAKETMFKGRIAHGMLSASLISAIIGEQLPGHGTIYMKQNLTFTAPVRPDDTVIALVKVVDINLEKRRVTLECQCRVGDTVVLKGEALVLAPKR